MKDNNNDNDNNNNIFVVEADRIRLSQVISNLIRNAIKFTTEGVILITTRKYNAEDDNDNNNNDNTNNNQVIVSVKDTGSGIDPEILPRLFTKFATKSFEGTLDLDCLSLRVLLKRIMVERYGLRIILMEKVLHLVLVFQ